MSGSFEQQCHFEGAPQSPSVSIYFPAGNFTDVLKRHLAGDEQTYATHGEVARLIYDLRDAGYLVTIYSVMTAAVLDEHPIDGIRVVSLGLANIKARGALNKTVT